jgi:hypothetical protein
MPPRQLPGDDDMPRVQAPDFGATLRLVVSPGREEEGFFQMPGGESGNSISRHYALSAAFDGVCKPDRWIGRGCRRPKPKRPALLPDMRSLRGALELARGAPFRAPPESTGSSGASGARHGKIDTSLRIYLTLLRKYI